MIIEEGLGLVPPYVRNRTALYVIGAIVNQIPLYPHLETIATWVRDTLGEEFPHDTNGVWWPGNGRPIRTLGVALKGNAAIAQTAAETHVDAVLLHRPWGVVEHLSPDVGVIAVHEALDERLTTAENPWLARALGFVLTSKIRTRYRRPLISMATTMQPVSAQLFMERLVEWFPELECRLPLEADTPIYTIAFANAVRPALLAIAAECGASVFLTGKLPEKTHPFFEQSPITAIGLGQQAAELWGLCWLARTLERVFGIDIVWLEDPCGATLSGTPLMRAISESAKYEFSEEPLWR